MERKLFFFFLVSLSFIISVPVTTAQSLQQLLHDLSIVPDIHFEVLSNPEFLAEGTAVRDLEGPDRVLVGGNEHTAVGRSAIQHLVDVYANWVSREKIITTSTFSSELIKLASNSFLAMRISSINSIGMICEETFADIEQVSRGIGLDARLGPHFLKSSLGYGGSCFKKDVLGMAYMAESLGLPEVAAFWRSAVSLNELRKARFCDQILRNMHGTLRNKKVLVLGVAFKANTGDTRESPALSVIRFLLEEKAKVHVFDPVVESASILSQFPNAQHLTVENSILDGASKATAIIVCTEWPIFRDMDWNPIYETMLRPAVIFDGRLILDKNKIEGMGFQLHRIGCSSMKPNNFH